jgi:hypothetical protein
VPLRFMGGEETGGIIEVTDLEAHKAFGLGASLGVWEASIRSKTPGSDKQASQVHKPRFTKYHL